ncbi:alpha-L-fucosidase [Spiroplasma culicicola]|uniref:alpha-L-fucosidase n=1 Tax=Spiroplasma culicicola AES-1 TaxID=1276246 RepID=W6A801_9MOLU|nr:alpha-L-fucosidase [Spiroplasma culicicola]AHI53015.1 alpha-L-fucosidase [Spiroplasma culicicola AES-1]
MKEITRVQKFREYGLGLFIHYGLYNQLEKGEWYQEMYKLTTQEYLSLFSNFSELNLQLNIKKIVSFAKENNFKYIVFTTKHHDGFALYDSKKISSYDITMTKTRDIVKEFIAECNRQQIEPFLYYATWDWSNPKYNDDFDEYLEYMHKNIEYLCKEYKNVKGYWFDGNWNRKEADWKEDRLYKIIRKYNPEAMIINNSGLANAGKEQHPEVDSITFEQGHMKKVDYTVFSRDLAAETCQTFNDHWGYAKEDYNYKSVKDLISKFLTARKQKANYLLNLSVDKNGELIPLEIETVKIFNKWVNNYGYSLIGNYDLVSVSEEDFIIKKNKDYYIFLYNVITGGHVKKIQFGGNFQEERKYNLDKNIRIKSIKYLDNSDPVEYEIDERIIKLRMKSFDYGINTIVRVIKMEEE